jgi:DNA-binding transcriptional regulator YiaG
MGGHRRVLASPRGCAVTYVLDRTGLTWTHAAPPAAERRRVPTGLLFLAAGVTAATCTMCAPALESDLSSITAIPASQAVNVASVIQRGIGAQVRELKVSSGLTWAQFAALFGVTRRAVHFWVEGGKISADHLVRVERIRSELERVGGATPDKTRAALFSIGASGRTPFAALVAEVTPEGSTPERSPLGVEEASVTVGVRGRAVATEEFTGIKLRKW